MTVSEHMPTAPPGQSTASPAASFGTVKGFGRGYDQHEVDEYVHRQAVLLHDLGARLQTAERELAALRARLSAQPADSTVAHAVSVLTTAQETAEQILNDARDRQHQMLSAAAAQLEQSQRAAAERETLAERRAQHTMDEAHRRASAAVRAAEARAERLTASSDEAQHTIDRQAAALRTFRDATRIQVHEFLDDALDNIAEQYGRAQPLAAQAAGAGARSGGGRSASRRMMGAHRARRARRVAGRPSVPAETEQFDSGQPIAVSNGFAPGWRPGPGTTGPPLPQPRSPQSSERAAGVRA